MAGTEDWASLAQTADAAELREHILTGSRSGKPFTPYVPTIDLPSPPGDVLDFGCGLGRNFPLLKKMARRVTGFDLPAMVARCRTLAPEPADVLLDDWSDVTRRRFDLIFATLALQHIETDACVAYLRDFAALAPVVYLLTRTDSDFGRNVLQLVHETGLFAAGPCVEVDHDPGTHQLRVLGRKTFDEVRQSSASAHYEVLLSRRA